MKKKNINTFQKLVFNLQEFWKKQGCIIIYPLDLQIGAATSHYMTALRSIGPEPISLAYIQPCRRPSDGRYTKNNNRMQHYYQFQVIIKPSPLNFQDLYLKSLYNINENIIFNDIKFIEDNWENPTLGACGVGWEVWLNGLEISQITYFQQLGGITCSPISGEITYGLERISMILQNVDNIYDIIWDKNLLEVTTYKDLFFQSEIEFSQYNFNYTDICFLSYSFDFYEKEIKYLLNQKTPLVIPAYESILKASHNFNLLDARKSISSIERQRYITRLRNLTKSVAIKYYEIRKKLNFPLCKNNKLKK